MADEESELGKPLMIFGKDVRTIPCFRNSFLYGISSGLGAGVVVFMLTSKPRWTSHAAIGTFGFVTLTYWSYCRYEWVGNDISMHPSYKTYREMVAKIEADKKNNIVKEVNGVDV